jgi:hypothetical protein
MYNGSMWMMTVGAKHKEVWAPFNDDPEKCKRKSVSAGYYGSDQGWICYALGKGQPTWTDEDGVLSYSRNCRPQGTALPSGARIVFFEGMRKPWDYQVLAKHKWIREHWR